MDDDLKALIYQLECQHLKPENRMSQQELSKILANDFFEIGSSGNRYSRSDYSADVPLEPDRFLISDFLLHPLSHDAVLTTYRTNNETRKMKSLRSSVWRFRDGEWKLYFHQGTRTGNDE